MDSQETIGRLLEESGAILRGHFILTSGRHSAIYFEKFRLLEQPRILSQVCEPIAEYFRAEGLTHVAGPTTGGIIIAYEIGRQLNLPTVYIETENGTKTLRRGKVLPRNARVGLVDDVLTTGISLRESKLAIEQAGAIVVAIGVLIDRSQSAPFEQPYHSAYRAVAESFDPDEVPDWLAALPATKPGTRVAL
jgi:orotate phosphoribosyltransferase